MLFPMAIVVLFDWEINWLVLNGKASLIPTLSIPQCPT